MATETLSLIQRGPVISFEPTVLAEELLKRYYFKCLVDNHELFVYIGGVYRPYGEEFAAKVIQDILGPETRTHRITEVLDYVKRATYIDRSLFDRDELLNVRNGLVDLKTGELLPHSPDILSTIQLPIEYEPTADCPRIRRFFREIVAAEDVPLLEEVAGFCLQPGYRYAKAVLLVGTGSNGKTSFLNLLRSFLGPQNCASVSLQSLESNRFAAADLVSKLANLCPDLPSTALRNVSVFKALTGGDWITVERKYSNRFQFQNRAKLIFSANQPPAVTEDNLAFWRRWVLIRFPNTFEGADCNPKILDELTTPQELSGLLNVAIRALRRLEAQGGFSYRLTVDDVAAWYRRLSDPVFRFVEDECVRESEAWVDNDSLFEAFKRYSERYQLPSISREAFGRRLLNIGGIRKQRAGYPVRRWGWQGLRLKDLLDEPEISDEETL